MFNFTYNNIDFAHKLGKASEPENDYNKHLHPFNELLYFIEGDVKYNVESESKLLQEGDLVLIRPGKYHFAEVNDKRRYDRYVLKFPDSILPQWLIQRLKEQNCFFGNAKKFALLFNQLDSYHENFAEEEIYTLFTCELTKMLIFLCKENNETTTSSNGFIAQLTEYIDENLQSSLSIETLSKQFNFSKSYISNEFKRIMKIPIMQYVRHKKIIAAHQMILAGEKKSAVAEMFDFKDYSTFYRSYVKIIGHAPMNKDTK